MQYNKYLQNWNDTFTKDINKYIKDAIRDQNVSDNGLKYLLERPSRIYGWIALQSR